MITFNQNAHPKSSVNNPPINVMPCGGWWGNGWGFDILPFKNVKPTPRGMNRLSFYVKIPSLGPYNLLLKIYILLSKTHTRQVSNIKTLSQGQGYSIRSWPFTHPPPHKHNTDRCIIIPDSSFSNSILYVSHMKVGKQTI